MGIFWIIASFFSYLNSKSPNLEVFLQQFSGGANLKHLRRKCIPVFSPGPHLVWWFHFQNQSINCRIFECKYFFELLEPPLPCCHVQLHAWLNTSPVACTQWHAHSGMHTVACINLLRWYPLYHTRLNSANVCVWHWCQSWMPTGGRHCSPFPSCFDCTFTVCFDSNANIDLLINVIDSSWSYICNIIHPAQSVLTYGGSY